MIQKLIDLIRNSMTIALFMHMNPDGDAVGSAMMMKQFIRDNFEKKEIFVYADTSKIDGVLNLMLGKDGLSSDDISADLSIALDCSDADRIGEYKGIFEKAKTRVNIDHHISNNSFGDLNFVSDCSSNSENLFNILENSGLKITKSAGEFCAAGMMTDTNALAIPAVSSNTYLVMSKLKGMGVDTQAIRNLFFDGNEINVFKILGRAMTKTKMCFDGKVMISTINKRDLKKCGVSDAELGGVVNQLFNVKDALICCLISPRGNKTHISFRSKAKVDVSSIAKVFGGGGHICAAAADTTLKMREIKNILNREIARLLSDYTPKQSTLFQNK